MWQFTEMRKTREGLVGMGSWEETKSLILTVLDLRSLLHMQGWCQVWNSGETAGVVWSGQHMDGTEHGGTDEMA